jgi:hypothetical protein
MGHRGEKDRRTENLTMRTNLDLPSIGIHIIAGLPVDRVYAVSDELWRELVQMGEAEIDAEVSSGRLAERIRGQAVVMDVRLDDPTSDSSPDPSPDPSPDSSSSPASRCSRALGDDFGRET